MYEEVKEGIYKIDVPLPDNPLKATNSYLVKGKNRNLLIDTGMNRIECMDALNAAINSLGVDMEKTDLYITHLHADHLGLAFYIAGKNSRIYFNVLDTKIIDDDTYWNRAQEAALLNGFPKEKVIEARTKHPGFKYGPEKSEGFTYIKEKDTFDVGEYQFVCIETPGHTPGNTCLYEPYKKLFFSGDHVLWDITPNISAFMERGNNLLGKYLNSLDKISKLDVNLVLPGHRNFFTDLELRVKQLKEHHFKRVEEIKSILSKKDSQNSYQVASNMTWDLDCKSWEDFPLVQKWFATGEALAHLVYMEENNIIKKEPVKNKETLTECYKLV